MGPPQLAYTALEVSVDVAGVLTALGSLLVALLAHRRISKLTLSVRRGRQNERRDERESETSARE